MHSPTFTNLHPHSTIFECLFESKGISVFIIQTPPREQLFAITVSASEADTIILDYRPPPLPPSSPYSGKPTHRFALRWRLQSQGTFDPPTSCYCLAQSHLYLVFQRRRWSVDYKIPQLVTTSKSTHYTAQQVHGKHSSCRLCTRYSFLKWKLGVLYQWA